MRSLEGNIADLAGRRIFPGRVEWSGGVIRRIVPLPGRRFARTIAPGFVDSHVHIESSMLPPAEFARLAVVHGTVATVSDPHEIANVLGAAGVRYMLAQARRTRVKICLGAPPCVPATPFETAGAALGPRAVARLLALPGIGYLSEVMNFPGVLRGDPDLMAKIRAARRRGKPVDGHAPGLRGKNLNAYVLAGVRSDHESVDVAEAREKLRLGMHVLLREGSTERNLQHLLPLINSNNFQNCSFATDDKLAGDLVKEGHIDHCVRQSIRSGLSPITALQIATINSARHYRLHNLGAIAPRFWADFIVFDSLKNFRVRATAPS